MTLKDLEEVENELRCIYVRACGIEDTLRDLKAYIQSVREHVFRQFVDERRTKNEHNGVELRTKG